jgi:hypothetical protein
MAGTLQRRIPSGSFARPGTRLFYFAPKEHRDMSSPKLPLSTVSHRSISRRQALNLTASAALLSAIKASFPGGVHAAEPGLEVKGASLGFIALTDSAPLIGDEDPEAGFMGDYPRQHRAGLRSRRNRRRAHSLADALPHLHREGHKE